jgi:hypothetical protein
MSQIYTALGEIEPLDELKEGDVFFRKELDSEDGYRELKIVEILKDKKFRNIVDIYSTCSKSIDMELLDIHADDKKTGDIAADIRKAIEQLHSVGIIYIDIRRDNMGYSHTSRKWKLFDFDASGIVDKGDDMVWALEPPVYTMYEKYSSCRHEGGFKQLDRVILEEFLHTIK